jgi:outer membrane protein assembly factor BamD
MVARWIAAAGVAIVSGCGSVGPDLSPDDPAYKDPARRAYYEGMRELIEGDFIQAGTLFQAVATSPRHVRHAALAKLRLGDSYFFQGRWAEAAEVYRGFVAQHQSDPNLPYARFKVAECQYKRIPGEWFASPPAHEFDQTLTLQAEAEVKGFLTLFPTSHFAPRAKKMLAKVRSMLLSTELYAADFYADREQWQAVAWRLDYAADVYPELAVREDLVWRMAEAWQRVNNHVEAKNAWALYVQRFPDAARHDEAERRLEEAKRRVDAEKAPPPVAPPTPKPEVEPEELEPTDETTDEETTDEETEDGGAPKLRPPTLPPLSPDID